MRTRDAGWLVLAAIVLSGCGDDAPPSITAPPDGACRQLTADDTSLPANDSEVVDCETAHTAETYLVGTFPERLADASYASDDLTTYAVSKCQPKFLKHMGADESLGMRTMLSWVWFRPTREQWTAGARWFRCDVIGGGAESEQYASLPTRTEDLLLGKPSDEWMVCASGSSVESGRKLPCSQAHQWRAVTTIQLGKEEDAYPGDEVVEKRTSKFCSDSVSAWLDYPVDFDYSYTWFGEKEWAAGNRRSVCWAATER
ncbi:MAG: septum formation family protein [Nocardioides sp.]|jgi:hypothetical protein